MAQGTRIYDVVLMALLLYSVFIYTESSDTSTPPCSWGSWLPWNCSCCGGSIDKFVYRVRAHCCEETVCTTLRVDANKVTSIGTNYQQQGTCNNHCQFGGHHGHTCIQKQPTLDEMPNKGNSCLSVCLDIISTTTATTTTTTTTTIAATIAATTPHQPTISKTKSATPGPTVASDGNTDIPPTTLSVPSDKVMTGVNDGNITLDRNSLARVTAANCHLVLGIALGVTAVFVLY